ncbi:hypothetical protein [Membranihabitans marinus]|uniref:hypothetical protein n=1 Tax=Membranihabitans marinus TaxID=1227546 RepID=UPI001F2839EC|nr:hypothetical protein [Membranihabitans marinus]
MVLFVLPTASRMMSNLSETVVQSSWSYRMTSSAPSAFTSSFRVLFLAEALPFYDMERRQR